MTTLSATLAQLQLSASEHSLRAFTQLFLRWNRAINLSAARSEPALHEHIIDSLHVLPHLRTIADDRSPARVLDVGSGGGFPAMIAAICLPHIHVTALEPLHKKHAFLRTAARELALENLEPLAERLEDHPAHDYDAAMSRATFDLAEWLRLGRMRVRTGGLVLGFEAVPRDDLPAEAERHPYTLDGKARAIVSLRRT